jgi:hypothetical protein
MSSSHVNSSPGGDNDDLKMLAALDDISNDQKQHLYNRVFDNSIATIPVSVLLGLVNVTHDCVFGNNVMQPKINHHNINSNSHNYKKLDDLIKNQFLENKGHFDTNFEVVLFQMQIENQKSTRLVFLGTNQLDKLNSNANQLDNRNNNETSAPEGIFCNEKSLDKFIKIVRDIDPKTTFEKAQSLEDIQKEVSFRILDLEKYLFLFF